MTPAPRVLDLFCGAGGLSDGFRSAGYHVVGGIDAWQPAVDTFGMNFPTGTGFKADLRTLTSDEVFETIGGDIDVVVGGPSCQGFSTSGGLSRSTGRNAEDPRNRLFLNYVDLVESLDPSWIVFENVPGLLLYDQGKVALEIVTAFKEIGYSLVPMILLAADFGVPQLRRRLFFVGNKTGSGIPFPAATHGNENLWADYSLPFAHLSRIGHGSGTSTLKSHVTFGEACDDLPSLREGEAMDDVPYNAPARTDYQKLMRKDALVIRQHAASDLSTLDRLAAQTLLPGQNWRNISLDDLPDRFKRIRRYDATTILKRLKDDAPSYTITTKFNEATTGAFLHPRDARTISLREAARLQSFRDDFIFSGTPAQIRQQIGNAVPPLLAQAVAEAMYPAVMANIGVADVAPIRDSVLVAPSVSNGDILRLRAPRRPVVDAEEIAA